MEDSDSDTDSFERPGRTLLRKSSRSRIPTAKEAAKRRARSQSVSSSAHPSTSPANESNVAITIPLHRIPPNMPQLTGFRLAKLRVPDEHVVAELYNLIVWQAHKLRLQESEKNAKVEVVISPDVADQNVKKSPAVSDMLNAAKSKHVENIRNEDLVEIAIMEGTGNRSTAITGGDEIRAGKVEKKEEAGNYSGAISYVFDFTPPGEQKTMKFPAPPPPPPPSKNKPKKDMKEATPYDDGENVATIRARSSRDNELAGRIAMRRRLAISRLVGKHVAKSSEVEELLTVEEPIRTEQEESLMGRIALIMILVGYLAWVITMQYHDFYWETKIFNA